MDKSNSYINNTNYNMGDLPNDYQHNNSLNNSINFDYDDIDITYTYKIDTDEMIANRDKIISYLDSSDPYETGVIKGKEKIKSNLDDDKKATLRMFFVVAFVFAIMSVVSSYLTEKFMYLVKDYSIIELIQPIPFYLVFVAIGIHITLNPLREVRVKKARCKQIVNAKIVDLRVVYDRKNIKNVLPIYKFIYG